MAAILGELSHVALGRWVLPHLSIHGRGKNNRGFGSKIDAGKWIRGQTVGKIPESVCAQGCDKEQVSTISKVDMPGLPRLLFVLQRDEDRISGKDLQGEGSKEFSGRLRHYAVRIMPFLDQLRDKVCCLVSRDGSGYPKDNFHKAQLNPIHGDVPKNLPED